MTREVIRHFISKPEDCKSAEHKSVDCEKIKGVADGRKYLNTDKLCFNCTGTKH